MAITINTPAESLQLTTLARVKQDLGITVTDFDTILGEMIDQASDIIVSYCNRQFALENITETLPTTNDFNIILTRTPITTITSITFDGNIIPANEFTINEPEAGIVFNEFGWEESALIRAGVTRIPIRETREYLLTVIYNGGFVLPSFTSDTRNFPQDLERAAIQTVKDLWFKRERDPSLQKESIPNVGSFTYGGDNNTASGLSKLIESTLNRYRRTII